MTASRISTPWRSVSVRLTVLDECGTDGRRRLGRAVAARRGRMVVALHVTLELAHDPLPVAAGRRGLGLFVVVTGSVVAAVRSPHPEAQPRQRTAKTERHERRRPRQHERAE